MFFKWFKELVEIVDPGVTKIRTNSYMIYRNIYPDGFDYGNYMVDLFEDNVRTRYEFLLGNPPF